ncbi:MAG: hypothetical protein IT301_07725 [Dehalococcoidia bacterium]|nr:hypothetical protein [Dehalococcoidia bacterium]
MKRKKSDAEAASELIEIQSWDEMPAFKDEAEEAEWWATHSLGEELWDAFPATDDGLPPPGTPMGASVSLNADLAERLRVLARKKGVSYVALARTFVAERLYEEEKREGIIGGSQAS